MRACATLPCVLLLICGGLFPTQASLRADSIYLQVGSATIDKYSTAGVLLNSVSTGGNPETLSSDAAGDVFETDLESGPVEFPGGNLQDATGLSVNGASPYFYGTALDSSGNLYFAADQDSSTSSDIKVYRYNETSGDPAVFADTGTNTSFSVRNTVAVDPVSGNVFLADYYNGTINEYSGANASLLHTFTGLSDPWDIAVDRAGHLYVSNLGTGTLLRITIATDTSVPVASGLTDLAGVAVDSKNDVYVASVDAADNHGIVQEYSPAGTSLGEVIDLGLNVEANYLTVVPEPSSWAFSAGLGGCGLLLYRRRGRAG